MSGEDYTGYPYDQEKKPEPVYKEWYELPIPWTCRLGFHRRSKWSQDEDKIQWRYCLNCNKSQRRVEVKS